MILVDLNTWLIKIENSRLRLYLDIQNYDIEVYIIILHKNKQDLK